jgi:hypothetical protein
MKSGTKAGIGIGVTLGVIACVILGLWIWRWRKRRTHSIQSRQRDSEIQALKKISLLPIHPSEVHGNNMPLEADGISRAELE